jgi:NADPH-dependent 2,4-dienoyl-CoA reductase/sulfur reductase-like enzyme
VNASVGDHDRYIPAEQSRRLLVVGAGPAGMEAARVAAKRGHRVTLIDRERSLGGQMLMASVIKGKEPENLEELIEYYRIQLKKLSVELDLGTEYSTDLLRRKQPDAVLFCTGPASRPVTVPDSTNKIVVNSASLIDALKRAIRAAGIGAIHTLSKAWMPLGDRVVIVGGGYQGCQLAEFLIKRGRRVSLVEKGPTIGDGIVPHNLMKLTPWFQNNGVEMITDAEIESISGNSVSVVSGDQRRILEADSVITIDMPIPNARYVDEASDLVGEVHRVGGSREPGMILDAIADGYRIGHAI